MKNRNDAVRFLEDCYQLYEQKMYHIAYSILRDVQMAEDAVQEAFLNLIKYKVQFENPKSDDCKRYMITTIKNTSINMYRKRKREQELIYISDGEKIPYKDMFIEMEASGVDLEEMIQRIPAKYSDVIRLLVLEELSTKEAAGKLGINEANVRKRFERAKKILKRGNKNEAERTIYRTIHS